MHRTGQRCSVRRTNSGLVAIFIITVTIIAGTNSSCLFHTETNLCDFFARRCPRGQTCARYQDACIDIGGCGDNVIDPAKGEICDDGNIMGGDGCSSNCKSNETCGNGTVDIEDGELCDDGNTVSKDGCDSHCIPEKCGDKIVNQAAGEVCDDGNIVSGDGCSSDCKSNETCGNGITDNEGLLHEQCDPVNVFPSQPQDRADCDSDCTIPICGDGHLNPAHMVRSMRAGSPDHLEACDDGRDSTTCNIDCTHVKCGDGYTNKIAGEDCDLGTPRDSAFCDSDCSFPRCGDGHTNPKFMIQDDPSGHEHKEECDDSDNTSTCNGNANISGLGNCQIPKCGDGYINMLFIPDGSTNPEQCDNLDGSDTVNCNGNNRGNNGPGSCRAPFCGDGYVNPKFPSQITGEQCDPGNGSDIPEVRCTNGNLCIGCRC